MMKEYGLQLREKQKAKRYYGVLEKQFHNYYVKANAQDGMSGENLLKLIERRLDNVVYRIGLAESRRDARQLVRHGHFTLNGSKANIPSQLVKLGDVIAVKEKSRDLPKFKSLVENFDNKKNPEWLEVNKQDLTAKVVSLPKREDVDFEIQEHLIVELYSK
jgi:small subunit ribosomal protein S4